MNRNLLIIFIIIAVMAVALVLWAVNTTPPDISKTPSDSSTIASSSSFTPPASTGATTTGTVPPATTIPSGSVPSIPAGDKVGTLYTRAELDAMDNSRQSFWPNSANGKRPRIAKTEQRAYRDYKVHFMGSDSNVAHLTFNCDDDKLTTDNYGEPISRTALVLNILKYENVKATFFVTGKFCYKYPELVQRIIDEGHSLGNYGYSSVELPGLSTEEMTAEIMVLHNYVQEKFGYTMQYFRPYIGAYSQRTFALATSLGYTTILYSACYADRDPGTQIGSTAALEKLVVQIHNGVIYRLHPISMDTVDIMYDLLDALRGNEYRLSIFKP